MLLKINDPLMGIDPSPVTYQTSDTQVLLFSSVTGFPVSVNDSEVIRSIRIAVLCMLIIL